jgi:drug/metabolite transporter (DMT)-like permease
MKIDKSLNGAGLLHLMVVYIVWGSTYLFIRIAVQGDQGFPPFILGGTRVLTGGIILLAWSKLRGQRIRPTRQELITLFLSGLLLWVGGNGFLNWAETRVDSGLASLIIAAIPIWVVIVTTIVDRKMPTARLVGALLVGFVGILVLSYPTLRSGESADIWSIGMLMFAGLSWGIGSVLQSRRPVKLTPVVSAGYQQLFGSFGFLVFILLLGESWPTPSQEAWLAWVYLVIFGSLFAFTSYVTAIKLLPMKIVATYAYVNPVIALFLGWLILSEDITLWTIAGAFLVLLGVGGIFRERYRGTN